MDENGRTSERVLEQLRLLLDAVASRAQDYLNGIGADGGGADGGAAGSGAAAGGAAAGGAADDGSARCSGSAPCGWCPLCAAVSFARGSNPELASQLGEQVTGLVALLRQAVEQQSGADAGERPQPPAVQHIDVQRVGGSVLQDGACRDGVFEAGVSHGGVSQGGPVAERAGEREC